MQNPPDFERIRRLLDRDRIGSAYAIADLQPAFTPYCQWSLAESAEGDGVALLFTGLTPAIIVTVGPVAAVRNALAQLSLPNEIYLSVRLEHYPLLAESHSFRGEAHQMQRMKFVDPSSMTGSVTKSLIRLTVADADRLQHLYANGGEFAPNYFDSYQLQDGVYFGIVGEQGELIAAGGTHIVERQERIAAIGNMYTRADQRGKGYASAIVQAITQTLLAEGFSDIFLNVDPRNQNAHRLYQRFGFVDYCRFMEGKGMRRG